MAPRGVTLLQEVCRRSPVPVWAIGGVTREKLPELAAAGAAGAWGMGAFAQLPEK
ncbi:thiamine phosphate synthase [Acidaminococcus sp. AM05-11]|uniref:thiamine phosphate synthase n=1 Tax=Acidaminococcus sp. AM05-11 TaxID=2291997 RepID=UPI001314CE9F|nr:thiamine phosphate synthase [Acidaminococcus sp. AM05-11]